MTTEALPERIGPYQVVGLLGKGGMGSVYKAFKPPLRRYVAVKIIKADFTATPGALERFRREAELASDLKHPNIVTVFDYEEIPGGDSYIVTELIEGGQTLRDRMSQGAIPLDEVADILAQTASALDYAYDKSHIVHRDVKPSNIFLEAGKRVALGDFGIAKDVSSDTALTAVNQGIGTPDYMSPEQAIGEGLDRRSDIYSLGVVLYEMLVGRVPFSGDTPISVVLSHIQKPVPQLRDFRADLPAALQAVIDRALAKRKEDRYPTAAALADAFKTAIRPGLIEAPTQPVTSSVIVTASSLEEVNRLESTGQYQPAFDRLTTLHNQFPQDVGVTQRYQNYVTRGFKPTNVYNQPTNNNQPPAIPNFGLYNPPAQNYTPPGQSYTPPGGNQAQTPTANRPTGGSYTPPGGYPGAQYTSPEPKKSSLPIILAVIAIVAVAAAIIVAIVVAGGGSKTDKTPTSTAQAVVASPTANRVTTLAVTTAAPVTTIVPTTVAVTTVAPTTAAIDNKAAAAKAAKEGSDLYDAKNYKDATTKYQQATQLDPTVASYFEGLTRSYYQQDLYTEMEAPIKKAIEIDSNNAVYHYYLGYSYYWRNQYPEAEKSFKQGVQIKSNEALYQQYLARAIIAQERYEEAEPIAKKAVDLNPGLPDSHNTLGRAYLGQDKYTEAEKEFRAAASENSQSAVFQYNIALTLNDEGKYKDAETEARKAIQLDATYASSYQALSISLRLQERYDEALTAAQKATDLDSKDAYNPLQVALCLNALKRYPEAETAAQASIQVDTSFASAYNAYGDALYYQNKFKESVPAYENAVKNNSKSYLYLTNLAYSYTKTTEYDKARDAFNRALAIKADYKPALDGLAAIKNK